MIFDYATKYHYENELGEVSEFNFSNADFSNFKNFVAKSDFDFETKAERALREAMAGEDKDIFGVAVENSYKDLLNKIGQSKMAALDTYEMQLKKNLEDEIIKRYFYREGLYDYYLNNDEAILAATELLGNTSKYENILK